MNMVNAKINITHVQEASASRKPQIELLSSVMLDSLFNPRHFAIPDNILNDSLFKNREIIAGRTDIIITIIAITPRDPLINERLVETVFNDSPTAPPTIGIKLDIANFAVFIERESAPCAKTFFVDKTNINIDIIKAVTEVKVFFIVLDIPSKLIWLPNALITEKQIDISTIGIINDSKNCSTSAINTIIEVFATAPLDRLPFIMYRAPIIGRKAFIIPHKVLIYWLVIFVMLIQIEATVKQIHNADVIEKDELSRSELIDSWSILKIDEIKSIITIEAKLLIVDFKPSKK